MPNEQTELTKCPEKLDSFLASVETRAYRMAYVATGHREEALDIVQDAMFSMVQSYATRSSEQWPPLFYRVLQNRITDWHRKSVWRQRFLFWRKNETENIQEDFLDSLPASSTEQPAEEFNRAATRHALDKALHQLPLRQQQAFLMRQWEGFSVADTALAMGCSEGSVKTHTARAIASLRTLLKDYYPLPGESGHETD